MNFCHGIFTIQTLGLFVPVSDSTLRECACGEETESGCKALKSDPRRRAAENPKDEQAAADLLAATRPTREHRKTPGQEARATWLLVLAFFCARGAPTAQIDDEGISAPSCLRGKSASALDAQVVVSEAKSHRCRESQANRSLSTQSR